MISIKNIQRFCCEDPCLIENYDKAIADTENTWHCHHRLEVQGDKVITTKELKEQGLYWNRPAYELIFLTHSEHMALHRRGKASPNKGKKLSEEAKEKLSLKSKGKHWYTNGIKEVFALECPEGFVKGRANSLKEKMKGNSNGIHVSPVKGKRLPEEWRNNVIKAAKNRVLTEEQRKNLSIKAKEVWSNRELKEKQSKHSLQMWNNFTEEEYNSIVQKHKDYWTEDDVAKALGYKYCIFGCGTISWVYKKVVL